MNALDRRLHAFRPDLADIRLQGRVEAARFVAGEPARIVVPVADVKSAPDAAAGMDTQFLLGDDVEVFSIQSARSVLARPATGGAVWPRCWCD